jgi:hypothetical protein
MARFNYTEAEHYGGQGGSGFFSIPNDGDIKKVRFLYDTAEDIEGYAVHEVEVDGKKRYVNCLRAYNEPIDNCPFCKAQRRQQVKAFIPVYDVDDGKVKFWERGKKMFARLSALCARYPHLVEQEFEIQRHGAKGSKETFYDIMPSVGKVPDGTKITDLVDEMPKVVGGLVLDKTPAEMEHYLSYGSFPTNGQSSSTTQATQVARRTPATGREVF